MLEMHHDLSYSHNLCTPSRLSPGHLPSFHAENIANFCEERAQSEHFGVVIVDSIENHLCVVCAKLPARPEECFFICGD